MSKIRFTPLYKLLSVVLCVVMMLASASFGVYAERDFKAEIDALESKIDANNAKKDDKQKTVDELNEEIDTLQEQIDVYNAQINDLNSQITNYDAIIAQYESDIAKLDESINETGVQIDKVNVQIADTQALLAERMRASYMAGETSMLEILLGSSDFESFLTRLELLSAVAKRDNGLISDLKAKIDEANTLVEQLNAQKQEQVEKQSAVEADRAKVVDSRAQVQAVRNSVDKKQNDIQKKMNNINSYISNLDQESAEWRLAIAKIQAQEEEFNKQQNSSLSKGDGTLNKSDADHKYTVSSKGMISPLQYPNVVLSAWWGSYSGHKALDYTTQGATGNTYGKEIRAVADGTVKFAETGTGSARSYGKYVLIDHENGVATRYAHCSGFAVSAGQHVKQGDVIAYVGNTGNVRPAPTPQNPHAGAHLHFEVIVQGVRVNPEPWVPAVAHRK